MSMRVWAAGLLLAGGMATLARADDEKKPTPPAKPGAVPTDRFAGYVHAKDMTGEVVAATESSVTIRVFFPSPTATRGRGRPGMKLNHKDISFDYHPEGQARSKSLPPKTDADGKKGTYTQKELDALREPAGFPGYNLDKADVKAGSLVELRLLRDRTVPAAKATDADLKIKWVKVTGHTATPSATPTKK